MGSKNSNSDRFCYFFHSDYPDYATGNPKYTTEYNSSYDIKPAVYKSPPNSIENTKYTIYSFIPLILFEQFKMFFNMYFLLVAMSQLIPQLRIGYLITYFGPLCFVLMITMSKEALDDLKRKRRDGELNKELYKVIDSSVDNLEAQNEYTTIKSASQLRVGDVIMLTKNSRVPSDLLLVKCVDGSKKEAIGEVDQNESMFLRTDQLDGETDWKLKVPVPHTQNIPLHQCKYIKVNYEEPHKDLYSFFGTMMVEKFSLDAKPHSPSLSPQSATSDHSMIELKHLNGSKSPYEAIPLSIDNALWANTIVASNTVVYGLVLYTGKETKSMLNTKMPQNKVGIVDLELNYLSKVLFVFTFALSMIMYLFSTNKSEWYILITRFMILFSSIIPISLRVNLDMAKTYYSYAIQKDDQINDTVVRTSHLPEELGRIEYLLSDKTGTLTKNEMELKKLHLGYVAYTVETFDELMENIKPKALELVIALAVCHNVTPSYSEFDKTISYQASSPDEIAIVEFTKRIGYSLIHRDMGSIHIKYHNTIHVYKILQTFPFTSETKRMGIVIQDAMDNITLYVKGADTVVAKLVLANDWLDEETTNMAREGLRVLAVAKRDLDTKLYKSFQERYLAAQLSPDRVQQTNKVFDFISKQMTLLGLTGVEDKLQDNVKHTLETLREAGIKIWMLTGDKIETAQTIAMSTRLCSRDQELLPIAKCTSPNDCLDILRKIDSNSNYCLVVDGLSLQTCLDHLKDDFIKRAVELPAVVCCRCSPTQKADVTKLIMDFTGKRVAAIGDGGNDVSMIQTGHCGIGIVGKEGKQASLAADFSITQFSHIARLLLWHGRCCYKRTAKLSQFVIHRGLIISFLQAVFSSLFFFAPIALYQGALLVGYSTIFTMWPVFSLVLDQDVTPNLAMEYPELYRDLVKGRALNTKTFLIWTVISIYQGGIIMLFALYLFESEFIHIVAITFTALIFNELIMVAIEINTWHRFMVYAEVASVIVYLIAMVVLPDFSNLVLYRFKIYFGWYFYMENRRLDTKQLCPAFNTQETQKEIRTI
eukprot:NODE_207_length_12890_cov_0.936518.p2 type:complete len:1046 gc:universal NODE_207_length_12890_cov_0.936518:12842-9705(-)